MNDDKRMPPPPWAFGRRRPWLIGVVAVVLFAGIGCWLIARKTTANVSAEPAPIHGAAADPSTQPAWHHERVRHIRSETLAETIENLANFDDNQFAMTSLSHGFFYGDAACEMHRIVHLARVRRLFEEGRESPAEVIPLLRAALSDALDRWPDARAERVRKWEENPDGYTSAEPDNCDRQSVKAMTATYLLAELHDHDSLELLISSHQRQLDWQAAYKPYPVMAVPVPPTISLYAMHRLVATFPEDRLNDEARQQRHSYMEWTRYSLLPVRPLSAPAWNVPNDPVISALGIADADRNPSDDQQIVLWVYPVIFAIGEPIQHITTAKPAQSAEVWYRYIKRFAEKVSQ